jgi:hypothetical protein
MSSVCLFQDDSAARAGDEREPQPVRLGAPLRLTAASTEVSTASCNCARLGSARLGSARLGSARLDSYEQNGIE